jgi:predicted NACHT family NTPase
MTDAPQLFLSSQKISRLKDDVRPKDRKGHVCEAHIKEEAWETITRDQIRQQNYGETPSRRIGLVCPAGEGKTTNMLWLQAELARPGSRQLPLFLDLRERDHLNLLAAERLTSKPSEAVVNRLAKELHDLGGDHRRMVAEIQRYQKAGRIILLIDGLDHAPETIEIDKEQRNLGLLIQEMLNSDQWRRCPVWISGRPTAFGTHWKTLFTKGDWEFRRIRQLEERDIRFYMRRNAGGDWYDEFVGSSGLLLAIPGFCISFAQ